MATQTRIETDVAVIGAGTAGLAAYRAVKAAGKRALLIEGGAHGTTCARVGCMPSKLLIAPAEAAHAAARFPAFGMQAVDVKVDRRAVMERVRAERDRFVAFVTDDVEALPESDKLRGHATFIDDRTLLVDDRVLVKAASIVIATGSSPVFPAAWRALGDRLATNEDVFEWNQLPESVAVFGPGVIGLELGQAFHRLGVRVKVFGRGGGVGPLSNPSLIDYARKVFCKEFYLDTNAQAEVARLGPRSAYVLAAEDWHPGVIGIVASRLVERHRRPVVLVALDGERGRGSGRSLEGYDLLAGLTACGEHLERYGGHSAAAGVELERGALAAFADALDAHATMALSPDDLLARERVDAVVGGAQLGMELAEELAMLAPFGRGNPAVSLMVRDAVLRDVRPMGEGKHARFTIESDGVHARAVAFGCDGKLGVDDGEPLDATFALEVNEWRGVSEPRLVLRHAQPAHLGELTQPEELAPLLQPPAEPLAVRRKDELVLF